MWVRAAQEDELPIIRGLDAACFPFDDPYPTENALWWMAWEEGEAVGYAGLKWLPDQGMWFLCRIGVLPGNRGKGIAKRLTRARLRACEKGDEVMTYTTYDNLASANNLINCGFKLYQPEQAYGELHWRRHV